jgi:hypothetical protein
MRSAPASLFHSATGARNPRQVALSLLRPKDIRKVQNTTSLALVSLYPQHVGGLPVDSLLTTLAYVCSDRSIARYYS